MIPLTAVAAAKPQTNPWMASLWGGGISALIAAAFGWLLGTNMPILWGLALILIGVGPVLGYQLAAGKLGRDWKSIIGGFLGGIIPLAGWLILWPLFVWLFNRKFPLGRLYLGSLVGIILGFIVWWAIAMMMGQNPEVWFGLAWALAASAWGGSAAAFMQEKDA